MSQSFNQYRLVLVQAPALTECVWRKVEKTGCWQHETLDPSMLSERSAAAYFIWKSMQQNAVNCQTSDFGSHCYTQNIEKPRGFGSGMGARGRNK